MAFLIDSDILIYSLKGNDKVQSEFMRNEKSPKSISIISYGELLFGAKKSKAVEKNLAIVYRLKELFPVINIDKPIIETFSGLKADLQKSGQILDDFDLLIGATAFTMNLVLVTNNVKHFKRIKGLELVNWAK